jgi:hypothetical protein
VAVSKSEQLPEHGQVGPKQVADAVILMLVYIKERVNILSCIKHGGE